MYIPSFTLISQNMWKKPGKLNKKSKTRKNNRQNSENYIFTKNGTYVEKYTAGHLCTKFEEFMLIYEAMIGKNGFDLLLAVNWLKWPNCDATQTQHVVPPTECIYQVSNCYLKAC